MKNKKPKVSIIIPVYNGSNYMVEAIDSALAQDYDNFEVIVVNDGSSDDGKTEEIALSYGNKIRYYAKENGRVASAINYAIPRMEGQYFSWLSHDDLYLPDKISSQMAAIIDSKDEMTIAYCGYKIVDKNGNLIETLDFAKMYPLKSLDNYMYPLFRGLFNGNCLLFNKKYFELYGYFREDLLTTQDYDMWFRIARNAKIKYVPSVSVLSRFHENQDSKKIASFTDECDGLYISLMGNVSREEMIAMEGSPYLFYCRNAKYLKRSTDYHRAYQHAVELADKEKINKNVLFGREIIIGGIGFYFKDGYYKLKRINSILKERGIKYLARKIKSKL